MDGFVAIQSHSSTTPGRPTTFDCRTALLTNAAETTSTHALKARTLHFVPTMCQDADERMCSLQIRYKESHDQKIRNAPLSFTTGQ